MIDSYPNVPRAIGAVVSAGKATLQECCEVYSVEDVYTLLEIVMVDTHNKRATHKHYEKKASQQ